MNDADPLQSGSRPLEPRDPAGSGSPDRDALAPELDTPGVTPGTRPPTRADPVPAWFAPSQGRTAAPSPTSPPAHDPITREGERVWALDGLRGVAILGILPANLPSFAYPSDLRDAVDYAGGGLSEGVAHALLGTLVDVKFITLFAFLFGVGIALQTARAERSLAIDSFRPYFVWRLFLLAGIGLCHGLGLWYGDILFTYAGCGLLVFALRSFVKIPAVFAGLGALGLCMTTGLFLLLGLANLQQTEQPQPDRQTLLEWTDGPEGGPTHDAADRGREAYSEAWTFRHGTYAQQFRWRSRFWSMILMAVAFLYAWRLGGLMCLGVAVHELGWIHAPPKLVLRVGLALGFGLGLPLELGFAWARFYATAPGPNLLLDGAHYLTVIVLSAGYAALCFSFSEARWQAWPLRPLANAGRMALTVYLSETVLCTTLFYSYGLGRFGEPTRVALWGLTVALWLVLLAGATLWLRWFRMGPVEWAWRSLATAQAQPLLRKPRPPASPLEQVS
ncbi:MAG: DUF418 domain-containing protein [Planctomycetes bacterium]|nr:DUF418 domain-containing protein [Planctomycetota bacterium]